jgi:hypothetical protein
MLNIVRSSLRSLEIVACSKFGKLFLKNRLTFFFISRYYAYMFYRLGREALNRQLVCYALNSAPFSGSGCSMGPPPPPPPQR